MEKRTLLAIALSIIILVAFSYLSPQRPVQIKEKPREAVKEVLEEKEELPEHAGIPPAQVEISAEEKEIHVETDLYSAVFTTKGGTIKKWALKEYADKEGNPLSLVSPDFAVPPLSIILKGDSADSPAKINYNVDKDSIKLDSFNKSKTLSFSYTDASGLSIRKIFTFYKDNYRVDFTTEVKGVRSYKVALGSGFGIYDEKGTWVHIGPTLLKESDKIDIDRGNIEGIGFLKRLTGRKSKNEVEYKGTIWWIAQEDKYFASALASLSRDNNVIVWNREKDGNNKTSNAEIAFEVTGEKGEFLLYAGPKKDEILREYNAGLEHIIDFGFFSILSRPLFWLLKFLYRVVGNYGWAIVLITLIVRIPFIPLINKSQKSMKKLQAVQPHMAALKEKYKKDPQKLQKETMELYKKHKVNPVGGCLPMLIQLPVFFALYKILLIAIEIRGAPFILWIQDLSEKDPYYVLPIAMGLSMVLQQKMTPSGMDPKQAKIMMLMPIVFTFMFLTFPSGLVLYWVISNLLSIIQQYFVNKKTKSSAA